MDNLAVISVVLGLVAAIIIAIDLTKHKQSMKIMNPVWILTGLWAGALALIAYFWFGRQKSMPMNSTSNGSMNGMNNMSGMHMTMKMGAMDTMSEMDKKEGMGGMHMTKRPNWQSVTLSTLHCGAGCTLADLIGEWFLFFVPVAIGGSVLLGSVVIDYILALIIGIYFQYVAIKSMSSMKPNQIFAKAVKADTLSLTSWQIGMYGFMAIVIFAIFSGQPIAKTSWTFWFMMQIAMLAGFLVSFPVNVLLIRWGVKKAM